MRRTAGKLTVLAGMAGILVAALPAQLSAGRRGVQRHPPRPRARTAIHIRPRTAIRTDMGRCRRPTDEEDAELRELTPQPPTATATGPETLAYGGGIDGIGVTSGTPKVYLVFWGTQWGTQGTDGCRQPDVQRRHGRRARPTSRSCSRDSAPAANSGPAPMTQYCDGPSVAGGATTCPSGAPHVGYPTGGALRRRLVRQLGGGAKRGQRHTDRHRGRKGGRATSATPPRRRTGTPVRHPVAPGAQPGQLPDRWLLRLARLQR